MKVEEAKKALTDVGLIPGPTVTVEGKDGVVVSTTPAIGEAVEPGTTVTLYVGGTHDEGKHGGKGHD
jgi:beta-lactam-binding protein with PASTA domain